MKRNHTGHRIGAHHQNAKHDFTVVQRARALHSEGYGYGKISQLLDIGESTARDWINYYTRAYA